MPTSSPLPQKAVLLVNVHSRRGQDLFEEAVTLLQARGVELTGAHPIRKGDELRPQVRAAVERGAPMVILGGGDGSISSAVDELVGKPCRLGILPLGTANSFARSLGIPLDLPAAVEVIAEGHTRRVDLGVINGDYFANFATLGFGPLVSESVPHGWKKRFGRLGYLAWAITRMFRFESFQLRVQAGEEQHQLNGLEVRIANGPYHGGVRLVEGAQVDSGEILLQVVTGRAKSRLVWNWLASLLRLPEPEDITRDFRGPRFHLETDPLLDISIDGEVVTQTPALVEIAPAAVEVTVPRATT